MNPLGLINYRGRDYKGWIHEDLTLDESLLEEPSLVSQNLGAEILVDGAGRQVFRFELPGSRGEMAFGFFSCPMSRWSWLHKPYSDRVLGATGALTEAGFPCMQILAAVRPRRTFPRKGSLVIAREIPRVRQLPAFGNHYLDIHAEADLEVETAVSLGKHIASLHNASIFHGDLKSRHILLDSDSATFFLVDLEKCRSLPKWPRFVQDILAARDLIQLFHSLPGDGSLSRQRRKLLDAYHETLAVSIRSRNRIGWFLSLYGDRGGFEQGLTLLENLARKWKKPF